MAGITEELEGKLRTQLIWAEPGASHEEIRRRALVHPVLKQVDLPAPGAVQVPGSLLESASPPRPSAEDSSTPSRNPLAASLTSAFEQASQLAQAAAPAGTASGDPPPPRPRPRAEAAAAPEAVVELEEACGGPAPLGHPPPAEVADVVLAQDEVAEVAEVADAAGIAAVAEVVDVADVADVTVVADAAGIAAVAEVVDFADVSEVADVAEVAEAAAPGACAEEGAQAALEHAPGAGAEEEVADVADAADAAASGAGAEGGGEEARPKVWICSFCEEPNRPERLFCNNCSELPPREAAIGGRQGEGPRSKRGRGAFSTKAKEAEAAAQAAAQEAEAVAQAAREGRWVQHIKKVLNDQPKD